MQRTLVGTFYRPCTIIVKILAIRRCTLCLDVYDNTVTSAILNRRVMAFEKGEEQTFYCQLPLCGKWTAVALYDVNGQQSMCEIISIKKTGIPKQMMVHENIKRNENFFIKFAQRFAFNAGDLLPGTYKSQFGGYQIDYHNVLLETSGQAKGMTSPTPARILIDSKVIEVSKLKMVEMTVPMRLVILFHEFSHFFRNEDSDNELEADINGLEMYLSSGYPRMEAKQAYNHIFASVPSGVTFEREWHINNYIDNFEILNLNKL